MSEPTQLVVFTDLDGTLLDHDTYAWDAARPALEALKRHAIPLVPVTSKTRAELQPLRAALENRHPYVVENGAAACVPRGYFAELDAADAAKQEHVLDAGVSRESVREVLTRLRSEDGYRFQGFEDLGADEIARLTGLSPEEAAAANDRSATEPVLWQDSAERLEEFRQRLPAYDLRSVQGGRFLHVMGRFDKADIVRRLVDLYRRKYAGARLVTVALGDGPNDLQMLAEADVAVVVRGRHPHEMPLQSPSRVMYTSLPGPAGWKEAVLTILSDYYPGA